jgi:hypothetical protein
LQAAHEEGALVQPLFDRAEGMLDEAAPEKSLRDAVQKSGAQHRQPAPFSRSRFWRRMSPTAQERWFIALAEPPLMARQPAAGS